MLVRKSKSYFKKAGQSFILENISHFMKASYSSSVRQMDLSFLEGKYQYSGKVVKDVSSKVQFVEYVKYSLHTTQLAAAVTFTEGFIKFCIRC